MGSGFHALVQLCDQAVDPRARRDGQVRVQLEGLAGSQDAAAGVRHRRHDQGRGAVEIRRAPRRVGGREELTAGVQRLDLHPAVAHLALERGEVVADELRSHGDGHGHPAARGLDLGELHRHRLLVVGVLEDRQIGIAELEGGPGVAAEEEVRAGLRPDGSPRDLARGIADRLAGQVTGHVAVLAGGRRARIAGVVGAPLPGDVDERRPRVVAAERVARFARAGRVEHLRVVVGLVDLGAPADEPARDAAGQRAIAALAQIPADRLRRRDVLRLSRHGGAHEPIVGDGERGRRRGRLPHLAQRVADGAGRPLGEGARRRRRGAIVVPVEAHRRVAGAAAPGDQPEAGPPRAAGDGAELLQVQRRAVGVFAEVLLHVRQLEVAGVRAALPLFVALHVALAARGGGLVQARGAGPVGEGGGHRLRRRGRQEATRHTGAAEARGEQRHHGQGEGAAPREPEVPRQRQGHAEPRQRVQLGRREDVAAPGHRRPGGDRRERDGQQRPLRGRRPGETAARPGPAARVDDDPQEGRREHDHRETDVREGGRLGHEEGAVVRDGEEPGAQHEVGPEDQQRPPSSRRSAPAGVVCFGHGGFEQPSQTAARMRVNVRGGAGA